MTNCRCVIIGSSFAETEVIKKYTKEGDLVLCADGGLKAALEAGIRPFALIGDGDSGGTFAPPGVRRIMLPAEKNLTDTEACIDEGLRLGKKWFTLLGCTGGRADHYFANAWLLELIYDRGGRGMIADGDNEIYFYGGEPMTFDKSDGFKYISIIPADRHLSGVTISGVKYPLKGHSITRGSTLSVSNEPLANTPVYIEIKEGRALIIRSR